MKASISSIAFLACISASYPSSSVGGFGVSAFQLSGRSANSRPALLGYASTSSSTSTRNRYAPSSQLYESSTEGDDAVAEADAAMKSMSVDEQKEKIGNLVADDEWMGLSMEITELVRTAIIEDVKGKTSDFIGKEEYKVGDISKELDSRIKDEIANLRGKEEYELGDLSLALDKMSKDFTMELTGKDSYETGDLSKEVDKRVKNAVTNFCGKEDGSYEFGDLSKEVDKRVRGRVAEFTGKGEYSFGDITKEIEERRQKWVGDYLGEEAAKNYQFGDITKKALSSFTGNDEYEFGDVTKKVLGNLFGPRKRGGKN